MYFRFKIFDDDGERKNEMRDIVRNNLHTESI